MEACHKAIIVNQLSIKIGWHHVIPAHVAIQIKEHIGHIGRGAEDDSCISNVGVVMDIRVMEAGRWWSALLNGESVGDTRGIKDIVDSDSSWFEDFHCNLFYGIWMG